MIKLERQTRVIKQNEDTKIKKNFFNLSNKIIIKMIIIIINTLT